MLRPCCSALLLFSSLSAVSVGAAEGPVDLFFGDLRVQGGLMDGGVGGNLGLTFGDIGGFSRGYVDTGYIMGVRGVSGSRIEAIIDGDSSNKQDFSILGLQTVAGFGISPRYGDHVELLGGYGTGMNSQTGRVADVGNDGRYDQWLLEFGYYHTMQNQFQLGATFGYTWTQVEFTNSGVDVSGRANGFSLAGSLGYRL